MPVSPTRRLVRSVVLPLFARVNPGDVTVRHHFTGDPIYLHSFRHKGYWFKGKKREERTMNLLPRLIRPGATVLDVGGHIGYLALYFAHLAGPAGHVWVFEPGENNLPYTHRNLDPKGNITIIEKGAGATNETLTLYMEDLTGQNNSFVQDFYLLDKNKKNAGVEDVTIRESQVEIVRLDDFASDKGLEPEFVKIDVEGFEASVVEGMKGLLTSARPIVMFEIQADHQAIIDAFGEAGYALHIDSGRAVRALRDFPALDKPCNVFALHREAHARELLLFTA